MNKWDIAYLTNRQLPDGSLGKTFSDYLRKNGYPVDEYPKYQHRYEDGRVFPARAYPNEVLGELRKYFVEEWLKNRARNYFAKRDEEALPYIERLLGLPNYREVMGYIEEQPLSEHNKNLKKALDFKR